jgi:Flp pilus assembly protein TadD
MTQTDFASGLSLMAQGHFAEAAAVLQAVRAAAPHDANIAHALGLALFKAGDAAGAETALAQAQALAPGDDDILAALAHAQAQMGRWENALETLTKRPPTADVLADRALALNEMGRHKEAETTANEALTIQPDHADALNALGLALNGQARLRDAEAIFRHMADAGLGINNLGLNNLGNVLKKQGRLDEAAACYRALLAQYPDAADIHFNLAHTLLLGGDLRQGFAEYEWRLTGGAAALPVRDLDRPRWHGEDWGDKTLLIHAEQGFGDTIQFARFLPELARRGRVVAEIPRALVEAIGSVAGDARIVAKGDPLPAFDLHCPLISVAHELNIGLDDLDGRPYLSADPRKAARWAERLNHNALRIGVVWAGNPSHADDRNRSMAPSHLAPLWTIPGISWFSLQKDTPIHPPSVPGPDLTPELGSFADSAAVLVNLDLLITVDTAMAHLAGALGVPCLLLLAHAPDWRWLLGRDDSPWYDSLRLIRQPRPGDWQSVVAEIKAYLTETM